MKLCMCDIGGMKAPVFGVLLLLLSMTEASLKVTRSSRDGRHPNSLELEVALPENGKSLRLPLTRTDAFENMPVTVMRNGVSRTFSARQLHHDTHAHYNDIQSKSVMSVREVNGHKQFTGHFMHEGRSYFVEPVGKSHNITAQPITPQQLQQHQEMERIRQVLSRRRRQTSSSDTTNVVEVAVCLDSSVYNKFNSLYSSSALTEIHYYYTHIMNGVDVTYRNIPGPVTFSVRSVSLTVSQAPEDDAWMPAASEPRRNEGWQVLRAIRRYKSKLSPQPDHVMAFTNIDLISEFWGSMMIGQAFLGGICTENGVSINEDNGLHSWSTASHELAHNLNAKHDGDNDDCSDSQNIMMPFAVSYTVENVAKSYRFSPCSVRQITRHVNSLGARNCLTSSMGSQQAALAKKGLIGARYTLDQVCKLSKARNPGKFHVPSVSRSPGEICAYIFCKIPDGRGGISFSGMRAPAGTHCGDRKSCNWNGACTFDPNAPQADESCFWGDSDSSDYCKSWLDNFSGEYGEMYKPSYCSLVKPTCCKTLASVCRGY